MRLGDIEREEFKVVWEEAVKKLTPKEGEEYHHFLWGKHRKAHKESSGVEFG